MPARRQGEARRAPRQGARGQGLQGPGRDEDLRGLASDGRRPGDRHRPRRLRVLARLRQGARDLGPQDHREPVDRLHARRHEDGDRRGPPAGPARGLDGAHRQGLRQRRGLDVEAEGRRGRRLGDRARDPDPGRQRLLAGVPRRAHGTATPRSTRSSRAPRRSSAWSSAARSPASTSSRRWSWDERRLPQRARRRTRQDRARLLVQGGRRSLPARSSCTATPSATARWARGRCCVLLHGITSNSDCLARGDAAPGREPHRDRPRHARPRPVGEAPGRLLPRRLRRRPARPARGARLRPRHRRRPLARRRDRAAVRLPLPRARRAPGAGRLGRPRQARSIRCFAPPPSPARSGSCR